MSRPSARFLALGAVQLGLAYGVSRDSDALPDGNAILTAAEEAGIGLVDTAPHYGCSEQVIGAYLAAHPGSALRVVSKLHPEGDVGSADAVFTQVEQSVARIGRPLEAVLLHKCALLDRWNGPIGQGLARARAAGLTAGLGVSVYGPDHFALALGIADITMIQAPMNVLDRRLVAAGLLDRAAEQGVQVVLRSAFLQGLLLMEPQRLPPGMGFAVPAVSAFRQVCARWNADPAAVALAAVRRLAPAARMVVGCHNVAQLTANLDALDQPPPAECVAAALALPQGDNRLVNPHLWQEPGS
ncbi:MAG TPA: aldo/keto reductase [Magnetospirillum sp.]|nr:aldo/keto reductase [Magnetospirillum sp.]